MSEPFRTTSPDRLTNRSPAPSNSNGSKHGSTSQNKPSSQAQITKVIKWSGGSPDTGNSLIHGDNLRAMQYLAETRPASFQCAYLDPPYNNGESYSHYEDSLSHEEWLDSVSARLEHVHKLLSDKGSLWISIDDSEVHYLKVATDQVFGRSNFVGTVVWERRTSRENRKVFSRNHEYLLVYAKDASAWKRHRNSLPLTEEVKARYKNPDNDPRGAWQSVSANVQDGHATPQQFYSITGPSGRIHTLPKGRCWIYSKEKMDEEIRNNNVWFGNDGNSAPRLKKFLKDRKEGLTPETLWHGTEVGTTAKAKKHLVEIFHTQTLFDTPKPEELIHRVLHISTNPGDHVLDPYLGSGTTAAVAHKMGRHYVGIENGHHIKTHCVERLRRVIKGEPGGISPHVGWPGGGGYDFFRMRGGK